MRIRYQLVVLFILPSGSFAQNQQVQDAVNQKLAAIKYVRSLQTDTGGFLASTPAPNVRMVPTLGATNAAVKALSYLTGKPAKEAVPHADKAAAFVMSCFDPQTGGFGSTPGGKADVALTSIGVMAAAELGVPKEKYRKAMDYLKEHAKTFEEVRIAAAAVEAWGVKDCPFDLKPWAEIADEFGAKPAIDSKDGGAWLTGSLTAFRLRLGLGLVPGADPRRLMDEGQLPDGGWRKPGEKASDMASTYRVMRAYMLLRQPPRDVAKLRGYIAKCRNADGGYGVKPGEPSSVSGVYYASIVTKWLDEMGKK
jgi:prenyltransferase beta subunit